MPLTFQSLFSVVLLFKRALVTTSKPLISSIEPATTLFMQFHSDSAKWNHATSQGAFFLLFGSEFQFLYVFIA